MIGLKIYQRLCQTKFFHLMDELGTWWKNMEAICPSLWRTRLSGGRITHWSGWSHPSVHAVDRQDFCRHELDLRLKYGMRSDCRSLGCRSMPSCDNFALNGPFLYSVLYRHQLDPKWHTKGMLIHVQLTDKDLLCRKILACVHRCDG